MDITDSSLLAEQLGITQEKLESSKRECKTLREALLREKRKRNIANIFWAASVTMVIAGLLFFLYKVASTSDIVTHCNIDTSIKGMHLYGVVDWGVDVDYGRLASIEDGIAKAKALGCPLRFAERK